MPRLKGNQADHNSVLTHPQGLLPSSPFCHFGPFILDDYVDLPATHNINQFKEFQNK